LEASVDSDDLRHAESHRTIAKWLKTFITQGAEDLKMMEKVQRTPPAAEDPGYMAHDSTYQAETPEIPDTVPTGIE
jgi:hypothetical protein